MGEALADSRKQLSCVVAVLQETAAAGAQLIATLSEQEGLGAHTLEDRVFKVVEQVNTHYVTLSCSVEFNRDICISVTACVSVCVYIDLWFSWSEPT